MNLVGETPRQGEKKLGTFFQKPPHDFQKRCRTIYKKMPGFFPTGRQRPIKRAPPCGRRVSSMRFFLLVSLVETVGMSSLPSS